MTERTLPSRKLAPSRVEHEMQSVRWWALVMEFNIPETAEQPRNAAGVLAAYPELEFDSQLDPLREVVKKSRAMNRW